MKNIESFSTSNTDSKDNERRAIDDGIIGYELDRAGIEEKDSVDEAIEKSLIDAGNFRYKEGAEVVKEIYDCYSKAMSRRGREPLEEESFLYHFFEGGSTDSTYMFGDKDRGFLLGVLKERVFIPTHFAPKTLRGGYDLISDLGRGELPAVLAITNDLAETLKKMPEWKIEGFEVPSTFRGEDTKKIIAHNGHPQVRKLMVSLLADYLGKTNDEVNGELSKMGK